MFCGFINIFLIELSFPIRCNRKFINILLTFTGNINIITIIITNIDFDISVIVKTSVFVSMDSVFVVSYKVKIVFL